MAVTLPAVVSEKLGATRASLSQRKAASRLKFDQVANRLSLSAETPALPASVGYDQAAVTPLDIPDTAKQQATSVRNILVKLGIGNMHITGRVEPSMPITPSQGKETEITQV